MSGKGSRPDEGLPMSNLKIEITRTRKRRISFGDVCGQAVACREEGRLSETEQEP
ncbi:hypothetical protein HMPREF9441_03802 [Paraprevotella clara YIT 11840]|uniref:Uncharacterized protein n=1 Tax=Paraprevotella clara YIT 11840 TaxID=762968 RepID=G5SWM9_9BACT|nr:hypothetical protein HMPREF9441_03802 [Paraprevotella clara YIT 11840]